MLLSRLRSKKKENRTEEQLSHLPAGRAVAVTFILEERNVRYHPVIYLRQGQSLVGRALYRFRDEVGVRKVSPGVLPRSRLPRRCPNSLSLADGIISVERSERRVAASFSRRVDAVRQRRTFVVVVRDDPGTSVPRVSTASLKRLHRRRVNVKHEPHTSVSAIGSVPGAAAQFHLPRRNTDQSLTDALWLQ